MKSTDRLSGLLILVPYFLARPGISLTQAAYELGTTPAALRDDLALLFVCGLPGYGPGDLIDMSLADDTVTITYDAGMSRPLRLTSAEAIALLVALRSLAQVPGLAAADVVNRALTKVEKAAGPHISATASQNVTVRTYAEPRMMSAISGALDRKRALRITYYSAARDTVTERIIDPMRLVLASGTAYVEAWCRRANAVRIFRLDRIDDFTELDEPARVPSNARPTDLSDGVFQPHDDSPVVELTIGRASRWITEYYPCERVSALGDGRWLVRLRASDTDWARRLVMSLGDDVEIIAPKELAHDVAVHARAALAAYEQV